MSPIPFNRPSLVGHEFRYIADAVTRGHTSGNGTYTKRCHAFLEELLGCRKALLTTSCTHALEMAALLLDIQPGDEVVVPSFTFVSTANAFLLRGAKPVFADIRADTLNVDETLLAPLLSERTKAVVPVHYAGVGCEMDDILRLCAEWGVSVVEDNAHGLFASYRGRLLGTFGAMATQSFHETKNIICGEGGALIVNEEAYVERAEILREKGTNRSRFFRGQIDKYTWVDVGSSFLPSDVLAAILLAQLERFEAITARRKAIWETYWNSLSPWAARWNVQLPYCPSYCDQSYHMFYLILPTLKARTALIDWLNRRGIVSAFHYQPLHLSKMGLRYGGREGLCPITEAMANRLLRLPFYNDLSFADQARVIEAVETFESI